MKLGFENFILLYIFIFSHFILYSHITWKLVFLVYKNILDFQPKKKMSFWENLEFEKNRLFLVFRKYREGKISHLESEHGFVNYLKFSTFWKKIGLISSETRKDTAVWKWGFIFHFYNIALEPKIWWAVETKRTLSSCLSRHLVCRL